MNKKYMGGIILLKNIGVIGAGVVGMATGMGFHELGHTVIFYDVSQKKLDTLKAQKFLVAKNIEDLILRTDISFVCVDTPTEKGEQDLKQINSTLMVCTKSLNKINKFHLLVYRSTMLPSTMRKIVDFIEKNCSKKRIRDYDICYNPEFLRENYALEDFRNPDRIVIGVDGEDSSQPLQEIYENFAKNILVTNFETAEMIKYVSNCFLSLKISFFNEMGIICKNLGIDDRMVSKAVSLDKRIGEYGTIFGKPFGGACLPKDTQSFVTFIEKLNIQPDMLKVVLEINEKISNDQKVIPHR